MLQILRQSKSFQWLKFPTVSCLRRYINNMAIKISMGDGNENENPSLGIHIDFSLTFFGDPSP